MSKIINYFSSKYISATSCPIYLCSRIRLSSFFCLSITHISTVWFLFSSIYYFNWQCVSCRSGIENFYRWRWTFFNMRAVSLCALFNSTKISFYFEIRGPLKKFSNKWSSFRLSYPQLNWLSNCHLTSQNLKISSC